jgi:hypothetical protein
MIDAKFMRDHFTLVTITDNPAPQVYPLDPEDLRYILEAITSGSARLRGPRCEFSDNRAAWALTSAAALITEALERTK